MRGYLLYDLNLLFSIKKMFNIRIFTRYIYKNIQFKKIKVIFYAIRL